MSLRRILAPLVILLVLSACATPPIPPGWSRKDGTPAQFHADSDGCTTAGARLSSQLMANPNAKEAFWNVCMHLKGWQKSGDRAVGQQP